MTAAQKLEQDHRALYAARVRLREGGTFVISPAQGGGEQTARRARGCLLTPEPGDLVLVAMPEPSGERYILSVLESDARAHIGVEGDAVVTATGKLSLLSKTMEIKADEAGLFAKRVTAAAGNVSTHFGKLRVFAKLHETIAESFVARVQRAYRFVEEFDQLRAQHIDHRAEQSAQIRGETTAVTARQVIKIDGESVHIG